MRRKRSYPTPAGKPTGRGSLPQMDTKVCLYKIVHKYHRHNTNVGDAMGKFFLINASAAYFWCDISRRNLFLGGVPCALQPTQLGCKDIYGQSHFNGGCKLDCFEGKVSGMLRVGNIRCQKNTGLMCTAAQQTCCFLL